MKRILVFSLMVLLVGTLFASSPSFGYNVAPVGESFGGKSFAGLEASAILSVSGDKHIGDVEVNALLGLGEPMFKGVNVTLSTPLYMTTHHPFNYCFVNVVLWEPKVTLGWQYRTEEGSRFMAGFAPLHFADRKFTYEFLSPYVVMDTEKNLGWGFKIMKFTAYIGG